MMERHRWTWPRRHDYGQGPPQLEVGLYTGHDVLVGWSWERHPREWTLALHLPCVQLLILRVL